jgi:hypothetical protein
VSILEQGNQVQLEDAVADALVEQARDLWLRMVVAFNEGSQIFWRNPDGLTPQQIADSLGSRGVEVFTLHGKLGALLAEVNPSAIGPGMAVVGSFQYNEDGTVAVTSQAT